MTKDQAERRISRRELLAMALLAVGLRVALYLIATSLTDTGFREYANAADGYQFIAYAQAWLGDASELAAHPNFRRLFPGTPALIALLVSLGVPVPAAVIFPSWLASGAVAPLSAIAFRDRRIGWAAATLIPSFVFHGSLVSTEALCLFFSVLGVVQAGRGHGAAGGLAAGLSFGLGGLCRPVAVFAMLGAVAQKMTTGHWRQAAMVTAAAGLTVAAGLAAMQWRFGDALMNVRRYQGLFEGGIFTVPFQSLITTPLTSPVPAWKLAFVGVHVLAVLGGSALVGRELLAARDTDRGFAWLAAVWLGSNTLYVLCIGDIWGFHDFPRFLIPALPPLFWAWRRILPTRPWVWLAVGALSLALALPPTKRRLLDPVVHGRPVGAAPAGSE